MSNGVQQGRQVRLSAAPLLAVRLHRLLSKLRQSYGVLRTFGSLTCPRSKPLRHERLLVSASRLSRGAVRVQVGRRAHAMLLVHMQRYVYSAMGALRWKRDVTEYADILRNSHSPTTNAQARNPPNITPFSRALKALRSSLPSFLSSGASHAGWMQGRGFPLSISHMQTGSLFFFGREPCARQFD